MVVSPEVKADGRVTFRIRAPRAERVALDAADITALYAGGGPGPLAGAATPAIPPGATMPQTGPVFTKSENGIWEAAVGPLPAGAYRYAFQVDGVRVVDPLNRRSVESNANVWSLLTLAGSPLMDIREVPHGAVVKVFYYSTELKTTRRMHIYTPPGYESGNQKYPVFYLLHGAGDTDDSWTSVGNAGFIMDNLIADKKAKPMIVVMPDGHQPGAGLFGAPPQFTKEFATDILPYVEKHYRTFADRPHRAIAGLSMGGLQTMDIAFTHLEDFAQIGIFSAAADLNVPGRGPAPAPPAAGARAVTSGPPPLPDFETAHLADLDNARLKPGTRLIWLSTGVDDFLLQNTKNTVALLKKHGFDPVFKQTLGGHTYFNWRNYLVDFAQQLF